MHSLLAMHTGNQLKQGGILMWHFQSASMFSEVGQTRRSALHAERRKRERVSNTRMQRALKVTANKSRTRSSPPTLLGCVSIRSLRAGK